MNSSADLVAYSIGVLALVLIIGVIVLSVLRRRQDAHRIAVQAAGSDDGRLSRSSAAPVNDPLIFGGGTMSASATTRRETVAYGYLGVAEEYVSLESGAAWTVLSVTLPGWAPYLVVDARSALGRAGVPAAGGEEVSTGDASFDEAFVVVAAEPEIVARVLTSAVRALLTHFPLQRVSLSGRTMLLRTFDQNHLTDTVMQGLDLAASEFLAAAPKFVLDHRLHTGQYAAAMPSSLDPLPQGFYGEQ